jgi:hypothetical protein
MGNQTITEGNAKRFEAVKKTALGGDRKVKAFAIAFVDDTGEVHWGNDFKDASTSDMKAMAGKLSMMAGSLARASE